MPVFHIWFIYLSIIDINTLWFNTHRLPRLSYNSAKIGFVIMPVHDYITTLNKVKRDFNFINYYSISRLQGRCHAIIWYHSAYDYKWLNEYYNNNCKSEGNQIFNQMFHVLLLGRTHKMLFYLFANKP